MDNRDADNLIANKPVNKNHTFVVLAYKESEYLKNCIESLLNQTVSSNILIATSTDNNYIRQMAERYGLQVTVNHDPTGIAGDFDFGLAAGKTEFVTIAHQDDYYEPGYLEEISKSMDDEIIIIFTDYYEEHPDGTQHINRNLRIKRIMLAPLRLKCLQGNRWIRRRILSLGNPICCPAVTFHRSKIQESIFQSDFRSNMDWKAWELLSRKKGRFVYVPKQLMMHRIHEESTTTEIINEGKRRNEDFRMMCLFWPKHIAKKLSKIYAKSEKNNH